MTALHWELSVLSRAVPYRNLSGASANIGISQPQLSRIISKIESELGIVLLDRSSRRKSGWTPLAYQLAELQAKSERRFERDLQQVVGLAALDHVRIGALEGLVPLGLEFSHQLFSEQIVKQVEFDVHDLNKLEELFFKGEYDLIFVSREPAGKKLRYSKILGYQSLDRLETGKDTLVASSFEFASQTRHGAQQKFRQSLVSNSLLARQTWIEKYGGTGVIPSAVQRKEPRKDSKSARVEPVVLIGSDLLPSALWERVSKFKLSLKG